MGVDPCKMKNASTDEIVLKVMTVALLMNSWLARHLHSRDSKAVQILHDLSLAHACILSLSLLTSFTLSPSVEVFYACRMIQSILMGQYVLLRPKANSKWQALWPALLSGDFFIALHGMIYLLVSVVSNMNVLFMFVFPIFRTSNQSFILAPLLPLFLVVNILDIGSL